MLFSGHTLEVTTSNHLLFKGILFIISDILLLVVTCYKLNIHCTSGYMLVTRGNVPICKVYQLN